MRYEELTIEGRNAVLDTCARAGGYGSEGAGARHGLVQG